MFSLHYWSWKLCNFFFFSWFSQNYNIYRSIFLEKTINSNDWKCYINWTIRGVSMIPPHWTEIEAWKAQKKKAQEVKIYKPKSMKLIDTPSIKPHGFHHRRKCPSATKTTSDQVTDVIFTIRCKRKIL